MRIATGLLAICLFPLICGTTQADVLTGPLVRVQESSGLYTWGGGIHDLHQSWSIASLSAEWFYGSAMGASYSNADAFVAVGMTDPTVVADASVFSYSDTPVIAGEGSTVFFRGLNGYCGAWRIDDIYQDAGSDYLDGQWYFVDDGSADFAGSQPVDEQTWAGIKTLCR